MVFPHTPDEFIRIRIPYLGFLPWLEISTTFASLDIRYPNSGHRTYPPTKNKDNLVESKGLYKWITSWKQTNSARLENPPWMNEWELMYFLLKMNIFQPVVSVFRGGNPYLGGLEEPLSCPKTSWSITFWKVPLAPLQKKTNVPLQVQKSGTSWGW